MEAILSDTYTNSVSFIMALINTVDYETRRYYQQNLQKKSITIKLLFMNVHEQDSPLADFLKIHSCNLEKFLVSILDPLTRNQLSVKQIMFTSSHCYSFSNSKNPSTLISLI